MSVRVGFIGAGGISIAHLVGLVRIPEAEVVALCDLSSDQIEQTRNAVNKRSAGADDVRPLDAKAYTDYRTMIRQEGLDCVYICLPPFVHGDPEDAALDAGLHIMVQKPLAIDVPVAHRILHKARSKGLIAGSGYQLRYAPAIDQVKTLLKSTTVGMALVMRFGGTPGVPWYPVQAKSGGQLIEMATHHVDQLRYLLGEVKTVYAAAATRINNQSNPDYDIFDVNCMTLTFESGVVANFSNNLISGHGAPAEASGMHFFCDGMTVSTGLGKPVKVITKGQVEDLPHDRVDPMFLLDQAFIAAVAQSDPSFLRSDYESGLRTLAVTVAGEQSARTGQPVHMADFLAETAPGL